MRLLLPSRPAPPHRLEDVERILVSSCLVGRPVRYDGAARPVAGGLFERWRAEGRLVPFCPEIGRAHV